MLERELDIEVELVEGRYGEFTVLADERPILSGGAWTFLGVMPPLRSIREAVERALAGRPAESAGGTEPRAER